MNVHLIIAQITHPLLALTLSLAILGPSWAQNHPMDGLTPTEIRAAVKVLRDHNTISTGANFSQIHLVEPDKQMVLTWLEKKDRSALPPRLARVIVRDKTQTREIFVNLETNQVETNQIIDQGLPLLTQREWEIAGRVVKADRNIQTLINQAGITDLTSVSCAASSPGIVTDLLKDIPNATSRRLFRVSCFYDSANTHPFGVPLEGFHAIYDADEDEIVKIVQTDIVPAPSPTALEAAQPARLSDRALQPIFQGAPAQPNFKISNRFEVEWFRWSFHVRLDQRVGPVVSLVQLDTDNQKRMVAYQISLAEMYVPYQDPDANWRHRTFLDNAELGLGFLASQLRQGQDCPIASAYLSFNMASTLGDVSSFRNAMCIFERNTGNPEFRHRGEDGLALMQTELVVRSIPTVGNYDYVIDMIFTPSGRIKIRVGSTGVDAIKTVRTQHMDDATAAQDTAYGALVAPFTSAILHDHYFSFRLDLDIDGTHNKLLKSEVVLRPQQQDSPRDYWGLTNKTIGQEGPVLPNGKHGAFIVHNPGSKNALGHPRGYQIMSAHAMPSPLTLKDEAQKRAAFAKAPLWVTRYHPDERYSSGDFPLQHLGVIGLPAYSGDKQSVVNEDLVIWATIGFHHFTRAEDWPFLSTMWRELTLIPYGFFHHNPATSLVRPQPQLTPPQ